MLTNLRDGATSREEAREVITQDQQLQAAINALSGTVIEQSTSSITFGHDSSFGDITIKGGAAGRDIVNWYFDLGGLLLSEHCRVPYFEFKDMLKEYLSDPNRPADAPFDEAAVHELIEGASRLRASLHKDIEGSASS